MCGSSQLVHGDILQGGVVKQINMFRGLVFSAVVDGEILLTKIVTICVVHTRFILCIHVFSRADESHYDRASHAKQIRDIQDLGDYWPVFYSTPEHVIEGSREVVPRKE